MQLFKETKKGGLHQDRQQPLGDTTKKGKINVIVSRKKTSIIASYSNTKSMQ